MIARIWRATAAVNLAHLYPKHFTDAVLPRLQALPGFRGAYLMRRIDGDHIEFVVQTMWDSMQAVERFAGADVGVAVIDDEVRDMLMSFDRTVQHYDVLIDPELESAG